MMKIRARTNANVPAKGRLRDMADKLWSLAVKIDWDHQCAVCGHRGGLNSHHLLPRQHTTTRYDLVNGICLCRRCHLFCPDVSPHQNAAGFVAWLEQHHTSLYNWLMDTTASGEHRNRDCNITTNATYYCDTIKSLRQYVDDEDYTRIVGQKFSAWLDEN